MIIPIADELERIAKGEILSDDWSKVIYSVDAVPSSLYLYVNDCDAAYKSALEAGAISLMEPKDQFYGDRSCGVKDPVGNHWFIATYKEDLSKDELDRRAREYVQQQQ